MEQLYAGIYPFLAPIGAVAMLVIAFLVRAPTSGRKLKQCPHCGKWKESK